MIEMETISGIPSGAEKKLQFAYDNRGRRVRKTVSDWDGTNWVQSYERTFVYDGWNLIAELDGNGEVIQTYMWGPDLSGTLQGAGGVGGLLALDSAAEGVHFVACEGNGNVTGLVDASNGTRSATYEYDPLR